MIAQVRENTTITNIEVAPVIKINLIQLWVIKDRKIIQDLFQVVHKYEHYYLLQAKGFKTCASEFNLKSNSMSNPMFLY